jgi:serine protease AprX
LKEVHEKNITGENIGVAIVDTGIRPHPDFMLPQNRIVGFYDALRGRTIPYDDSGHGTHVAGIIGGNGYLSGGRYIGMAPKCNLIIVKVLNSKGDGKIENVMTGLNWILKNRYQYGIRVVNFSVGSVKGKEFGEDSEFVRKVDELWDAGMVVLAAAGNGGPKPQSIGAPGNSRKIITVGSSDSASAYSGVGPTQACIKKPDIVAPGAHIMSTGNKGKYIEKSGTSMSTPIVSGAIALLLSRYPSMTNLEVKIKLKNCADDLGKTHDHQGWGKINILSLLNLKE